MIEPTPLGDETESERRLTSLMEKRVIQTLIFMTDDGDGTFRRLRAAGATVGPEPADQPYGLRDCSFRDPSGNQVRYSRPLLR